MQIDNAAITELQEALAEGRVTAGALAQACLARIAAVDRGGPALNAVREVNPDAPAIAASFDGVAPSAERPLAGVPILLKDNIATGDRQHTTAGSLALAEARGRRDATLVARLRAAGAVILGKANLTEFANILAIDMPSGYSSLGGQVKNPYAPLLNERNAPIPAPASPRWCAACRRWRCCPSPGSGRRRAAAWPRASSRRAWPRWRAHPD